MAGGGTRRQAPSSALLVAVGGISQRQNLSDSAATETLDLGKKLVISAFEWKWQKGKGDPVVFGCTQSD